MSGMLTELQVYHRFYIGMIVVGGAIGIAIGLLR